MTTVKELKMGNYVIHNKEICEVKNISAENKDILIKLRELFSGKLHSLALDSNNQIEEADIIRKCGNIISKKKNKIKIMDSSNFDSFDAKIDENLVSEANEGDKVTYICFNNSAKILEIRK